MCRLLSKYLIIFFSAVNANLLQTCLELISALPASSSSVKDSSWNLCLTVTKAVLIKSCCIVRAALEVAPRGPLGDGWWPAVRNSALGLSVGPVWSTNIFVSKIESWNAFSDLTIQLHVSVFEIVVVHSPSPFYKIRKIIVGPCHSVS